jgi:hypothetical protein
MDAYVQTSITFAVSNLPRNLAHTDCWFFRDLERPDQAEDRT